MKRTYENALRLLESRRRKARPKDTNVVVATASSPVANDTAGPAAGAKPRNGGGLRGVSSLVGMKEWLQILGHSENTIKKLNIIHVAGTKGKGSTCAFTRAFLRAHGLRTGFPSRIGLYTSPDLRHVRERIQINDEPVVEEEFTRYFFEVWERLLPLPSQLGERRDIPDVIGTAAAATSGAMNPSNIQTRIQPRYLQLLLLVAFHTFIREKVDAAIFETHHGGEYDATNVIQHPVVTGITTLGLDHIAQLGPTLEDIAWHKAGIMKEGVPAFSAPQDPGPVTVMRKRADEKGGVQLVFIDPETDSRLAPSHFDGGYDNDSARVLNVAVQRTNCALAMSLTETFLQRMAPFSHDHDHDNRGLSSEDITEGIKRFSWPGRFEIIDEGSSQWFLDGAHNPLSLRQTAEWFARNTTLDHNGTSQKLRILIFSHLSEERDGLSLIEALFESLRDHNARPEHVIFTTYHEREDGTSRIDKTFRVPDAPLADFHALYSTEWKKLDPHASVLCVGTIETALKVARRLGEGTATVVEGAAAAAAADGGGMQALVTGSLHMVGGALNLLRP